MRMLQVFVLKFKTVSKLQLPVLMARLATSDGGWHALILIYAIPLGLIGILRMIFVREDTSIDAGNTAQKVDVKQIITPVNEFIHAITLVNEEQKLFRKDKPLYDVWLTRGIIFHLGEREISFEKDDVPFSEEIIIQRGYNLKEKFESPCGFLDGWDDDYRPECRRDFVTIVK